MCVSQTASGISYPPDTKKSRSPCVSDADFTTILQSSPRPQNRAEGDYVVHRQDAKKTSHRRQKAS